MKRPLRFQAGCHWRWLNLALVFLCLFCVVVHFLWLVNACCCCVRFSFPYQAKILAWGMSPKWSTLCRVGHKTSTQSTQFEDSSHRCIVYACVSGCIVGVCCRFARCCMLVTATACACWHSSLNSSWRTRDCLCGALRAFLSLTSAGSCGTKLVSII